MRIDDPQAGGVGAAVVDAAGRREAGFHLRRSVNGFLDRLVRPRIRTWVGHQRSYRVCGVAGLGFGALLAASLILSRNLSPWMAGGLLLLGLAVLYGVTVITKLLIGRERIVNYHHQVTFLALSVGLFWLLDQPILAYLDAAALGLGMFIACGRVGCLMNGCCHGRPHRWGVAYRDEHVRSGFPSYLCGVRLFPIQGVEALWTFGVVATAAALVLSGRPPGLAFATYVVAYGSGRFFFELLRGDPDRTYLGGFSASQWLSVVLVAAVAAMGWNGLFPAPAWHGVAAAGLLLSMAAVTLGRWLRETPRHRFLDPRHVREVAEKLETVSNPEDDPAAMATDVIPVHIETTSLGVQISRGEPRSDAPEEAYYALSSQSGSMTEGTARTLATLIQQLRHPAAGSELVRAHQGVFHFMIGGRARRRSLPVWKPNGGDGTVSGNGHLSPTLHRELTSGFLCAHNRLNAGIAKGLESASSVYALIELLEEKGLIDPKDLEERKRRVGERLEKQFIEEGMAVTVQDPEVDKYTYKDEVVIDCESRLDLCQAACCRLHFPLSKQDLLEGVVLWNLQAPYVIAQGEDGFCVHLDRGGCGCSVYERRPLTCRAYDCRNDQRIWIDFERRIPNPALEHPDWPQCVSQEAEGKETREAEGVAT